MNDLTSLCCISSEHKELVVCCITISLSTTNKVKWMSWNSVWLFITLSSRIINKQLYSLWQNSMQNHGRTNVYSPDLMFSRDTKQMIENWFYIETRKFCPWSKTMGSVRSKSQCHQRQDFCFDLSVSYLHFFVLNIGFLLQAINVNAYIIHMCS